ncbi:protein DpdE [Streptomyces sp. NPDC059679]|uniref:protein DpdE n=1 Tax=Streptomyces sp. NPDC059679 TaxID=3346903 RepID=UPI00367FD3FB
MPSGFAVGHLVEYKGAPGIGRVGAIDGEYLRVDFFESIAEEVAESRHVLARNCWRAYLEPETRVYFRDSTSGDWMAGRVTGHRLPELPKYFVQFPNQKWNAEVDESDLRVRWDRPVRDPLQVLTTGGNESAYFGDARLPLLRSLVAQRAASANAAALLSSAVEIYPHQVRAAMTVLSDPVQRYLIADEVGLGKTIVAGFVVRQTLLDDAQARVIVLAPEHLRRQWVKELCQKFFIDDFAPDRVVIISHDAPERWSRYHESDLLVVDEAHALVQDSDQNLSPYRELATLAHAVPKLLLLSATPVTSRYATHLGLLHLLDPHLYSWDDREAFEHRYARRAELARCVFSLEASLTFFLRTTVDEIRELLPHDERFEMLAARIFGCLTDDDFLREGVEQADLALRVEELRGHISETYRLHRRVIRHRRDQVVLPDDGDADFESYAVRGRELTDVLLFPSAFEAAEAALVEWRTTVWNHLLDNNLEEKEAMGYARILAVLASRLGGPFEDFADALRWRIYRDTAAANRAGLTKRERALLSESTLLPSEEAALSGLEPYLTEAISEPRLRATIRAMLSALRKEGRIAIFCGPGSLAHRLAAQLREQYPNVHIAEHTRQVDPDASEAAVTAWRSAAPPSILVVDDTAEDGLNLQFADAIIHLRLPWSPNQLEQRIGRVDRYRGAETVGKSGSAHQYVLGLSAEHEAIGTAWLALLRDGYEVFSRSVSTLQDAIAEGLDAVWSEALRDGPPGLVSATQCVRDGLLEAHKEIEKMDQLDSIYQEAEGQRDLATALRDMEGDWSQVQAPLLRYTGKGGGGINLRRIERTVGGCRKTSFDLLGSDPHMPPRLYSAQRAGVTPAQAEGTFNRSTALRSPGTRLFRIGNPLVDMLAAIAGIDERGQASAFKRPDKSHMGEPEPYFGFDYLVETDIAKAKEAISSQEAASLALQRQADRLFPPLTVRVWVPAGSTQPVTLNSALDWLNRPYNNKTDDNFNSDRLRSLVDLFGGWPEYKLSAEAAEKIARAELLRVTELADLCAKAQERAGQQLATARAQAEARRAAGRLLGDVESQIVDVEISSRLIEGLGQPNVRLIAATCIVRYGAERWQHHA